VVAAQADRPKAPPLVEQFIRLLVVANKAVSMYPPSSDIPGAAAAACAESLKAALSELPDLRLTVTKSGLFYGDAPIFPGNRGFKEFSQELSVRKLAEVRFHAGIRGKDLISFLTTAQLPPDQLDSAGGFEARLWELGVDTITVRELRVTIVETQLSPATDVGEEVARADSDMIEEALTAAMSSRTYDQVALTRVIADSAAIRDYLQQVYDANNMHTALVAVGERFSVLAEAAAASGEENQHELFRALAEAIAGLSVKLQRDLLVQHVLPDSRRSPALAGVVRQLGVGTIAGLFAHGVAAGEICKDDLVRALRELVLLSPAEREEIIERASSAMLEAGISGADVAEVVDQATPARITVGQSPTNPGPRPAETILTMLDIPRNARLTAEIDPHLDALRTEACRGTTDSDIISAMVSLAGLDTRPAQFASTMSTLEDSLDYLIESGGVEVAAEAAISLGECAKNPELTPEQRLRVEQAIDRFARPSDIRELARTMQVYPVGSPEYEAARQLFDLLGRAAVKPLLENLADEPSMAVRKSLVDLLSTMARDHATLLGASVSDSRWYFVRNVVAILSSTKSSAVLMYLERTLRHPDARVRRETIRGLSGINDRLATEMLVASLADEDVQNVQLAARYLGESGARGAVPALEAVARGEGRGSRDTGPRVEAIEALGRIGAVEALPTLEGLAGRRSLLGGGRSKELRAAADAAIAAIKSKETLR
jgi:HEAT repeat protein